VKFVSYSNGGSPRIGLVEGSACIDLDKAERAYRKAHDCSRWQVPVDLKSFVAGGESNLRQARRLRDFAAAHSDDVSGVALPLAKVELRSPLTNPFMLAEMEGNFRTDSDQSVQSARGYPAMTILPDTVFNDPGGRVTLPAWSRRVTVNAQIAFVCGHRVEGATVEQAEDAIFGYTLMISFAEFGLVELMKSPTERDRSINEDYGRWLDGFKPVGPWIITPDEAGPIVPRSIRLTVGAGDPVVTSTASILHKPADIIAALSFAMPFYPGDIIGLGAMSTPVELSQADRRPDGIRVAAEVEGIGTLECVVVAS
jgi:2-keto-4-pentenoate hydratase/2-oxohepta-3-ene-1,7-dioic acid hydratase in catechol pathway